MLNTQSESFPVDEQYELKLKQTKAELAVKRDNFKLPPLTQNQDRALANNLSFACYRVAKFIFNNQGERTDTIAPTCAVANVSDTVIGFEKSQTAALASIGLKIECQKVAAKNRYGSKGTIGVWWLSITDHEKWLNAEMKVSNVA